MVNLIHDVNTFLLTKITPYATIIQGAFLNSGSEEIMCRQEPSNAVETRYLDGTRTGGLSFSYYAKSTSQVTARTQLDSIVNALDLAKFNLTDGYFVKIEAVTLPNFVTKTQSGEYIYTASFKLEYIGG